MILKLISYVFLQELGVKGDDFFNLFFVVFRYKMEMIEQKASQNMEGIVTLHRWAKLNSFCNDSLKDLIVLQVLSASEKSKLLVMVFNIEITCIHCCLCLKLFGLVGLFLYNHCFVVLSAWWILLHFYFLLC